MIDINKINGNEIIDFLNNLEDNEDIADISIVQKSFVFDNQKIQGDEYSLEFTASFNNWGTEQEIHCNKLHITKDELWFSLEEPFEGDGTDDTLEKALTIWIQNHTFDNCLEDKFRIILEEVYQILPEIGFTNSKRLQEVIDMLIKAKTYMK